MFWWQDLFWARRDLGRAQEPVIGSIDQREQRGALSRERLLEATLMLVAQRGCNGTGVDAITRRAGVSKSSLYWHFRSKDGLLAAALDDVVATWIDEIAVEALRPTGGVERLDALLRELEKLCAQRPERLQVLLAVLIESEGAGTSGGLRRAVQRTLGRIRARLSQGMAEALPQLPSHRVRGASDLALQALAGATVEFAAERDLDRLGQRLRVIRKMVLLFLGKELEAAAGAPAG